MKYQDIGTQTMLCENDRCKSNGYRAIAMYLFSFLANRSKTNQLRLQESGFSLIESLIAVAVVSILIVAIAPMVALSTSARINARRIDQATQAARSYVDAVRGGVIDTTLFPASLIRNTPNAQGQYVFEDPVIPSNSIQPPTPALLSLDSPSATTPVRGIRVDANGDGFRVDDPQDLFIQPMRSGPSTSADLKSQGFWLAVRVYRADALAGTASLRTGTEVTCASSKTPFSSTASITCPIVTIRSQIPPVGSSININEVSKGIGSTN